MIPTVLIVEDDPEQRAILRRYLRDVVPRSNVVEAQTGAQAVLALRRGGVHMVITDQRLRGWATGMQVAALARARGVPAHVVSTDPLRLLSPDARRAAVDKRDVPARLQSWLDVAMARAGGDDDASGPPPAPASSRDFANLRRSLAHVATIIGQALA